MDIPNHQRIRREGDFFIDIPPREAFKLFTAAGERLWVPGWDPTIFGALPQGPGLVFMTGLGPDQTIWTVLESDQEGGHLRYSRVTPGSKAGTVEVELVETGEGSTVTVTYDLTALEPGRTETLAAYSPARYGEMMSEWRSLIEALSNATRASLRTLVV